MLCCRAEGLHRQRLSLTDRLAGAVRSAVSSSDGASAGASSKSCSMMVPRLCRPLWPVELAPLGDPADVPQAVLAALGIPRARPAGAGWRSEPADRLLAALADRRLLPGVPVQRAPAGGVSPPSRAHTTSDRSGLAQEPHEHVPTRGEAGPGDPGPAAVAVCE